MSKPLSACKMHDRVYFWRSNPQGGYLLCKGVVDHTSGDDTYFSSLQLSTDGGQTWKSDPGVRVEPSITECFENESLAMHYEPQGS